MLKSESVLKDLYQSYTGNAPVKLIALPASGSDRSYYRMLGTKSAIIGAWNDVVKENDAFIYFSQHFKRLELPVPEVFIISPDRKAYLQTDLGDETLFSILSSQGLSDEVVKYYTDVVRWLPTFQVKGIKDLDLSYCFPRKHFDRQSMMWDLNYFKYYFARLSGIVFDEQGLEDDFETLVDFLLEAETGTFMFRDFQSRNVMILNGNPFFIDYQGGRSGPLQYDIASLLYDAKANLPPSFRNELMGIYLEQLQSLVKEEEKSQTSKFKSFTKDVFLKYFDGFVLLRILQALGAYGYRGYYQKKEHFLQSIPFALRNLDYLFSQSSFSLHLPELTKLLKHSMEEMKLPKLATQDLVVRVTSFSFKQSIPLDTSGNGGGFVFDCRALPNPGRLPEYRNLTGLDEPVINYLKAYPEMSHFLENVYNLVDASVKNYIERGFKNLMVNFGCTGGQHRSVYSAEKLAVHLNEKFGLKIVPEHTEKSNW